MGFGVGCTTLPRHHRRCHDLLCTLRLHGWLLAQPINGSVCRRQNADVNRAHAWLQCAAQWLSRHALAEWSGLSAIAHRPSVGLCSGSCFVGSDLSCDLFSRLECPISPCAQCGTRSLVVPSCSHLHHRVRRSFFSHALASLAGSSCAVATFRMAHAPVMAGRKRRSRRSVFVDSPSIFRHAYTRCPLPAR